MFPSSSWFNFRLLLLFCLFLFRLGLLFLLKLPLFLLFNFYLHSLQLRKAILNLQHHLIPLFFFLFQLLWQLWILLISLSHPILILISNRNDFLHRYRLLPRRLILIQRNHISNLIFQCHRLIFIIIHQLSSIKTYFIKSIKCFLCNFLFRSILLPW